ncbi:MAG: hypothetical protein LPJ89_09900, partial [Hymenobacteraceae bacterium]|nr:hypothetical protein [Hymenobacteraceae bacterium]
MKDNTNILALLMLLLFVVSWSVLHVLPQQGVVVKKYCKRELTKKEQLVQTTASGASFLSEHEQQMPPVQQAELKLCSVNFVVLQELFPVTFTPPVLHPQLPVHR